MEESEILLSKQPQVNYDAEIAPTHFYSNKTDIRPLGDDTFTVSNTIVKKQFKLDACRRNNSKWYMSYNIEYAGTGVADSQTWGYYMPVDHISEINQMKYISSSYAVPPLDMSNIPYITKQQCSPYNDHRYRGLSKRINVNSNRVKTAVENNPLTISSISDQYTFSDNGVSGSRVEDIDEQSNSIQIGASTNIADVTALSKFISYRLGDAHPNTLFNIDLITDNETDDTLEIYFNPATTALYEKRTDAAAAFQQVHPGKAYKISNLRLRYNDEQINPKWSIPKDLGLEGQILYIPYVDYQQLPLNNTGKQQLSFTLGGMPGNYLLSMFSSCFHQECVSTGTTYLPQSAFSANCTIDNATGLVTNNASWSQCEIELDGVKVLQLLLDNDYMGHLNDVYDGKENSLSSDVSKMVWGTVPFYFDTDIKNIDNYKMNIGRGLELTKNYTIKVSFTAKTYFGSSKNVIFVSYVILRPFMYKNGKFEQVSL